MTFLLKCFLWLVIYSFVGWTYESILCSITERRIVNRGFLNGPFCPVYGFGSLIVILVLGNIKNNIAALYFASIMLTCSVEYITAYILEKLFSARWWDYSKHHFNIHGRVCLMGAVVFGLFSVVLIEFIHPPVERFTDGLSPYMLIDSCIFFFIIIVTDLFITVRHILALNVRLKEIQEAINLFINPFIMQPMRYVEEIKQTLREKFESSEYYSDRIKALLRLRKFQDIRLARAFPNLKPIKYDKAWQIIKEKLFNSSK